MKVSEQICKSEKCTGCMACESVCPQNAITVRTDKMGFLYPKIDESKCVSCYLCTKKCPALIKPTANDCSNDVYRYCGGNHVQMQSSSGGFIPELTDQLLEEGYYIAGVIFADDFLSAKYVVTRSKEIISKMRKSKYIAADIGNILSEVESLIKKNERVLFVGLPCQVAALKNVCKDSENLVTVDLICHGNGSPRYYRESLESFCQKHSHRLNEIKNVDFRPKPEAPGTHNFKVSFSDEEITIPSNELPYYYGFNSRLVLRTACYDCDYCGPSRIGDITAGDSTFTNSELGESIVTCNTEKGKQIVMLMLNDRFVKLSYEETNVFKKRLDKKVVPKLYKKVAKAKNYKKLEKTYLSPKYVPFIYKIKRMVLGVLKNKKK